MKIPVMLPYIDPDIGKGFYINWANQMVTYVYIYAVIIPATERIRRYQDILHRHRDILQYTEIFSKKHALQFQNLILQMIDFDKFVSALAQKVSWWKYDVVILGFFLTSLSWASNTASSFSVFRNTFDFFIFNGKNMLFMEYSVNKAIRCLYAGWLDYRYSERSEILTVQNSYRI